MPPYRLGNRPHTCPPRSGSAYRRAPRLPRGRIGARPPASLRRGGPVAGSSFPRSVVGGLYGSSCLLCASQARTSQFLGQRSWHVGRRGDVIQVLHELCAPCAKRRPSGPWLFLERRGSQRCTSRAVVVL